MCMLFRYEYHGGTWIDLEQPTEEELREVTQEFSIDGRIEKELISPTPTPLVISNPDAALLVLHFPTHGAESAEIGSQEIDIVVGPKFIITVRYEVIAPLYHLKKQLETQKLVAPRTLITADVLFEILFVHLYTSVRDHINHVADRLVRIEQEMFDNHERRTVRSISDIIREFLHMEATLANQEEPISRFMDVLMRHKFFKTTFSERADHILASRSQTSRLIETHRAVATELRETNMALLEVRQNEIIKALTLITVLVLPLELIAVIFGMHAPGTPFEENPDGFLVIIGLMFSTMGVMTIYFARKRWIS